MTSESIPAYGAAHEIAPGIHRVRLPLPFALDHVNAWVLTDERQALVVDTGLDDADTRGCWDRLLASDGPLAGAGRVDLFVTHLHPDHMGLAGPLVDRFGGRLHMTPAEYAFAQRILHRVRRGGPDPARRRFLRRAGWPEDGLDASFLDEGYASTVAAPPDDFVAIADGDRLEAASTVWEVVTGAGHSPEHACLYSKERGFFLSGDQVLQRISSNVSVFPDDPAADPMQDWLASIIKIRDRVGDDVLVLPAHHPPFRGLHARLAEMERGHHDALDRLRASLGSPLRAVDAIEPIFRRRIDRGPQFEMATGESLACLNHLIFRDEVVVEEDADGVAWYRRRIPPSARVPASA